MSRYNLTSPTSIGNLQPSQVKQLGEEVWKNSVEKINCELFLLTYGSIVVQLIKDYEDYNQVNTQLEKMLIEDFLARTMLTRCGDFRETAEIISKIGFKMFLNIVPQVTNFEENNKEFTLLFEDNPLGEFVELPNDEASKDLWYSNILCGVIRGCLEMVQLQVECYFVKDTLKGDDTCEIRVKLIKLLQEEVPVGDD